MIASNQVLVDGIPDCVRFCSDFGAGVGQTLSALDGRNAPRRIPTSRRAPDLDDIESGSFVWSSNRRAIPTLQRPAEVISFDLGARSEGAAAKLMEVLRGNDAG